MRIDFDQGPTFGVLAQFSPVYVFSSEGEGVVSGGGGGGIVDRRRRAMIALGPVMPSGGIETTWPSRS